MSNELQAVPTPAPRVSLVAKMAERFSVEPSKLMGTLKATAFKQGRDSAPVSDEQMMALLIVADQYKLNPFTKEIFAFPDKGGIVPVVSVDGWARIINEHAQFDGMSFEVSGEGDGMQCTCVLYRKDRAHPTVITEYFRECKRSTQPWQSHPRRMLRHKSLIQCARLAFGFAGIYDEDEAQRIVTPMGPADVVEPVSTTAHAVRALLPQAEEIEPQQAMPDPMPEPAIGWLAAYTSKLEACKDSEIAALLMDEARDLLPPEEAEQLATVYRAKFGAGV